MTSRCIKSSLSLGSSCRAAATDQWNQYNSCNVVHIVRSVFGMIETFECTEDLYVINFRNVASLVWKTLSVRFTYARIVYHLFTCTVSPRYNKCLIVNSILHIQIFLSTFLYVAVIVWMKIPSTGDVGFVITRLWLSQTNEELLLVT